MILEIEIEMKMKIKLRRHDTKNKIEYPIHKSKKILSRTFKLYGQNILPDQLLTHNLLISFLYALNCLVRLSVRMNTVIEQELFHPVSLTFYQQLILFDDMKIYPFRNFDNDMLRSHRQLRT